MGSRLLPVRRPEPEFLKQQAGRGAESGRQEDSGPVTQHVAVVTWRPALQGPSFRCLTPAPKLPACPRELCADDWGFTLVREQGSILCNRGRD